MRGYYYAGEDDEEEEAYTAAAGQQASSVQLIPGAMGERRFRPSVAASGRRFRSTTAPFGQ